MGVLRAASGGSNGEGGPLMSLGVIALVPAAAVMHPGWNAMLKGAATGFGRSR